jgi:hypothetical protein
VAQVRGATLKHVTEILDRAARDAALSEWTRREIDYTRALVDWLEGTTTSSEMVTRAHTAARAGYFKNHPTAPDFASSPVRIYHRERSGYPVLMRDLDLAVPVDLFDVQENFLATGELRFLFPEKGWLGNSPLEAVLNQR